MLKEAAITVRVPLSLKRQIAAHARREKRSLSSQIATYLERGVASEPAAPTTRGRLLGLYEGTPVPSEQDFALVRRLLWGALGKRRGRRGA